MPPPIVRVQSGENVLKRTWSKGVAGLTVPERSSLIRELFFKNHRDGNLIERKLTTMIDEAADRISTRNSIRRDVLKTVLKDLQFLREGFGFGKRARGARQISVAALQTLYFQLADELVPANWGNNDFSDFGRFLFSTQIDGEGGPELVTSLRSQNLQGLLDVYSSRRLLVGADQVLPPVYSEALDAIEARQHIARGEPIVAARIKELRPALQAKIANQAGVATVWIKTLFSIQSKEDPLNFDNSQLLAPTETGKIMNQLGEWLAPQFNIRLAVSLREALARPGVKNNQTNCHKDFLKDVYWHIYDAIRAVVGKGGIKDKEFDAAAQLTGLMKPSVSIRPDSSSAGAGRFIEYFTQMYLQVAKLARARRRIERVFSHNGRKLFHRENVPLNESSGFIITTEDFHLLGDWSDYLKGRLKLGLVERGREQGSRLRLPGTPAWKSPSVQRHLSVDPLVRLLVEAAREALEQDAARQPA